MKRMTVTTARPIVGDFARWLKGWTRVERDRVVRVVGPLAQGVWVDRLRTGEYRPTFFVRVLAVPCAKGSMHWAQFLTGRVKQVEGAQHEKLFGEIVGVAEREVFPSVTGKLEPQSVLLGLEERCTPNPAGAVALAALAAFLNEEGARLKWQRVFWKLLKSRFASSRNDWEKRYGVVMNKLEAGGEDREIWLKEMIAEQKVVEGFSECELSGPSADGLGRGAVAE